ALCSDQVCVVAMELGGAGCIDDPCSGIGYLGVCEGDVAVWCDGGIVQREDCAASGLRCAYVDDRIGNYCTF
ncbi:MAG: hypothetical protein OEY14_10265, partial [Myxococcales bacterium]|nr:hypothetical protein [Myxococcales bacterium]